MREKLSKSPFKKYNIYMKHFHNSLRVGLWVLLGILAAQPAYAIQPPFALLRRSARVPTVQTRIPFRQVNLTGAMNIPLRANGVAGAARVGGLSSAQSLPNVPRIEAKIVSAVVNEPAKTPALAVPVFKQQPFPGKETIDGIIFDVDGVLLDSLPVWQHSTSNFLSSHGIEPPPGIDAEMAKLSLLDGANIVKERYGFTESAEELLEEVLAPIRRHYQEDIQPKAGAIELLKNLHAQGVKISVATAGDKELAQAAFERLGMMQYIDFLISCDEVGVGKQSPAVYDAARENMGTSKERTLVVEDALHALETAKEAGFLTAGMAEPFHPWKERQQVARAGDFFILSFLGGTVVSHLP